MQLAFLLDPSHAALGKDEAKRKFLHRASWMRSPQAIYVSNILVFNYSAKQYKGYNDIII